MPYTIPSYAVYPGSAYQPPGGVPGVVKANARALYLTRPGAYSSTRLLDQSPLNTGARRNGQQGQAVKGDGTDDEIIFGDIGTAIWFSGWVRLDSDNQCLFSLANTSATALSVAAGVLTAGATLTLSDIRIDDVSKTASEAGVLLNDNAWHFLSCDIGDGLGGASTANDVRVFTDGTAHGAVSGFDWRFYSTAPTSAELTEAYSGTTASRNSAAISKYSLWAKLDEADGVTAYDSSGNGVDGTLTNMTLANARITQDIYSFQNQVGYNLASNYFARSEPLVTTDLITSNLTARTASGDFVGLVAGELYFGDNSLIRVVYSQSTTLSGGEFDGYEFSFIVQMDDESAPVIGLSGDSGADFSLVVAGRQVSSGYSVTLLSGSVYQVTLPSAVLIDVPVSDNIGLVKYTGQSAKPFKVSKFWLVKKTETGYVYTKTLGSNVTNSFIPRDESDTTKDVLGNPLTNTGRRPNDAALINSNCLTADGTLYIGADHLAGSETVVSSGGTSTPSISAGRIDFTAGTCWDLILSDGTHYPLAEGWGVDVGSSSSDNDGVITNGVLANVWGATQDEYHFNILEGFSLYEHASTAAIKWPFKNGVAKSFTPPTGYTLTAECPFIDGFRNRAETEYDYNPDSTPEMGADQLGITVPAAHAFGDAFAASTQIFARQRTATEDRDIVMTEAQTGAVLTAIQNYTAA